MSDSREALTLAAFWTRVDADAALTAVLTKGTKYRFAANNLLTSTKMTPANCPAFAMAPAPDGHAWPPAKRDRGEGMVERFAIQAEMATAGNDRGPILNLADAFRTCVRANMRLDGFGVAALNDVDFSGPAYWQEPSKDETILIWKFQVVCICSYRIGG